MDGIIKGTKILRSAKIMAGTFKITVLIIITKDDIRLKLSKTFPF